MSPKEMFLAALDKPPTHRAAYLASLEPNLRQRVEELLAAHAAADSFLGGAAPRIDEESTAELKDPSATLAPPPTVLLAPAASGQRRLGPYDLLEVLGQGGFGTVYRAFDHKLHRVVAVKTLSPELAAQGLARQRFLREARAAAAVRHENVVAIHAVDEEPMPHLVMEYISGKTLQQKIDLDGALTTVEVLRIGSQIAAGLAAAHAQGLIHRDIKPSNILLENGIERVKISDFGLARAVDDSSISQSGIIAGTPMYMSPEQAEGKTLDHRSDIFSLGSTLYACATGQSPFRASSTLAVLKKVVEEEPVPPCQSNPSIPDWLGETIVKLIAKKPEERFASAQEVADQLRQFLADEQKLEKSPALASTQPSPTGSKQAAISISNSRRPPWLILALSAVAGLGGVLFGAATLATEGWDHALAVAGLVLFGAGFLGLGAQFVLRKPAVPNPSNAPKNRWGWASMAIVTAGVLFLVVMLERKGFTNFQRLVWFLQHQLTIEFPDASYTAEFFPTDDPP